MRQHDMSVVVTNRERLTGARKGRYASKRPQKLQ